MEKVSEKGITNYTQKIGNDGAIMQIRVEMTEAGTYVSAPVDKGELRLGLLSRDTNGQVVMSITNDQKLSPLEFMDMFNKSADVLAEILNITNEEE